MEKELALCDAAAREYNLARRRLDAAPEVDAAVLAAAEAADDDLEADEAVVETEEAAPTYRSLYCDAEVADVEAHLLAVFELELHGAPLFGPGSIARSEYDRLRLVNAVRDAVLHTRCPQCGLELPHDGSAASELAQHIKQQRHFFPLEVPQDDQWLVPRLSNDRLLGRIIEMSAVEDDDEEEEYPMVPTMIELARKAHSEQQREQ